MLTHLRAKPFDSKTKCGKDVCNVNVIADVAVSIGDVTCRTCLKIKTTELRNAEFKRTVYKPKRRDK
jgi:hypothetical protein